MKNEKLMRENRSQWGVVLGEEGVTPLLCHVEDENEEWGRGGLGEVNQGVQGAQENILL